MSHLHLTERRDQRTGEAPQPAIEPVAAVVAVLCVALADAERRAADAEQEAIALRDHLYALESWLDDKNVNRVEYIQRGRLLALAAEERAARRRVLAASPAAVGLLLYSVAMIALVYLLVFAHI